MTGSLIRPNEPIAVFGASDCMSVPKDKPFCDSAHQQLPPVRAMGSEYVVVRYRDRVAGVTETVPWRLVGAAGGTTLTWTPAPPPGAPRSLGSGEIVEFWTPDPFIVKSQDGNHPFIWAGT